MNNLIVSLFLLASVCVRGYELKIDTDYYGGDLYPIYNINSSLLCMNYCESVRGCRLATWCEDVCYLKNIRTESSEKLGCISFDMYPEDKTNSTSGGSNGDGFIVDDVNIETPIPAVVEPAMTEPAANVSDTTNPITTTSAPAEASSSSSNALAKIGIAQTLYIISLYYLNN